MTGAPMLRLRQLCLVALDLDRVVADLTAVLGLDVAHRDPAVATFGLRNAVLPAGDAFLEVVAPVEPGTAAGRYLDRRSGDGGYMVILDTDRIEPWRARLAETGIRIAADLAHDGYLGLQLHPRDIGGPLLEINRSEGWEEGAYHPAGPAWRDHVRTDRLRGVVAALIQSDDPEGLAARWGSILDRPVRPHGGVWSIALDRGELRFVTAADGRGEGLGGIEIDVADPHAVLAAAADRGCPTGPTHVMIGGVRFSLGSADEGGQA